MAQILVLKRAHFFSLTNDIIDIHARAIGSTALSVYTVLCRFANRKTGECWPSISKIAYLLDLARNTVKVALRKLEEVGLITIRRRRDAAGDPTSHLYSLLDSTPQAVEARRRRRAAEIAADRGRSMADPPWSIDDPPGRSTIDPKPDLHPLTKEKNQDVPADAQEETPQTKAPTPCAHPEEELMHNEVITMCLHCWTLLPRHMDTTLGDEEDQVHAACLA